MRIRPFWREGNIADRHRSNEGEGCPLIAENTKPAKRSATLISGADLVLTVSIN